MKTELLVSGHPGERHEAVRLCAGCPVIDSCRQAADEPDERFRTGVRAVARSVTAWFPGQLCASR